MLDTHNNKTLRNRALIECNHHALVAHCFVSEMRLDGSIERNQITANNNDNNNDDDEIISAHCIDSLYWDLDIMRLIGIGIINSDGSCKYHMDVECNSMSCVVSRACCASHLTAATNSNPSTFRT